MSLTNFTHARIHNEYGPHELMADVNPTFQTVTRMSLVTDISVSVILCFRSRMSTSSGGTNIVPFVKLHRNKLYGDIFHWLGGRRTKFYLLQFYVPKIIVAVCCSTTVTLHSGR
jgi:hypothetical protein